MNKLAELRNRIYGDGAVNGGRQDELDLAKFVVIFCLALVHCTIECTPESGLTSGIPYLFDTVIGGPLSAPLFMFAMGVGMVYTRRCAPEDFLRRGARLIGISYLFNICRFLIPFLIGYGLTGDVEKYIEPLLYLVLENDVLLFAGGAICVIALFVRLRLSDGAMLGIAFSMSLLGIVFNGTDVGTPVGNILLGYLIGTEDTAGMVHSYFPILNWLIVPVCGYVFGKRLRMVKDKRLFYGVLSPVCLGAAVVYFTAGIVNEFGMFGEGQNCYYHIVTPDAIASICTAVGMLGLYDRIAKYLPRKAMAIVRDVSRNITAVYCIHWVIISLTVCVGLYVVRGTQELPVGLMMLLATAISIVSMLLAHLWKNKKKLWRGTDYETPPAQQ